MSLATNLQSLATRVATEFKTIRTLISGSGTGDVSGLDTTATNLVDAINEHETRIDALASGGSATTLDDLTDVTLTSPADGQALLFDSGSGDWVNDNLATVATSGAYGDLTGRPTLGTAAATDATAYATAAQGALADSATQPGDLAAVATSGDAGDLTGTLPTAALPALAITKTNVVANQTAMLALTAEEGDVAIRTDNSKTYILSSNSPSTLADWKEIVTAGAVQSVNGDTGVVVLNAADVGAYSTSEVDAITGDPATDFVATFEAGLA